MSDCNQESNTCQTESKGNDYKPSASQSCCPIEMAAQKWSESFCKAMTEVQVEILKQRIKKSWGNEMEKIGDAVIETMGAEWKAILTQAKARVDLRENIKSVFLSKK